LFAVLPSLLGLSLSLSLFLSLSLSLFSLSLFSSLSLPSPLFLSSLFGVATNERPFRYCSSGEREREESEGRVRRARGGMK